uniref:Uncharacterized protein n=1 Tax=Arundo donax TaxID=35708 RepID=A0A0A9AIT3_ARUDO
MKKKSQVMIVKIDLHSAHRISIISLEFSSGMLHQYFFLQHGQRTSSIEVLRSLNQNDSSNFIFKSINETISDH